MSGLQQFDYGNWSVRTFVAADGQPWFVAADVSIRDAAQWLSNDPAISVGSVKLMAELRRLGWVDAKNVPYQSQITAGRMRRKSSTYIDPFGEEQVSITARLTVKGVRDLHRRLGGSQLPALALVSGGSL